MRVVLLVGVVGCYAPIAPSGAPCADDGTCPAGLACVATPDGDRCLETAPPPGGIDAALDDPDAPPGGCQPRTLLAGGSSAQQQGWEVLRSGGNGAFTLSTEAGFTRMSTSGNATQLLVLRDAVPPDRFILEFAVEVVSSGGHSAGNAAVALMASFHDPAGDAMDVSRMVMLDNDTLTIGGASIGLDTRQLRTYRIERTAAGGIRVSVPGGGSAGFGSFTSNGTIAIGDQSALDGHLSVIRIASITLGCP